MGSGRIVTPLAARCRLISPDACRPHLPMELPLSRKPVERDGDDYKRLKAAMARRLPAGSSPAAGGSAHEAPDHVARPPTDCWPRGASPPGFLPRLWALPIGPYRARGGLRFKLKRRQ